MVPYLGLLLIVCLLANIKIKIKRKILFFDFIIGAILVFFSAFRSKNVGSDTSTYLYYYKYGTKYTSFTDVFLSDSSMEIGYKVLEHISHLLSENQYFILLSSSIVFAFFSLFSLHKLSDNYLASIFTYVSFGVFLFSFNGIRQALALSIFMMTFYHILNKSLLKYVLTVLLASLFHKSVLICLPFYFLFSKEYNTKFLILLLSIGSILTIFMKPIISLTSVINERYATYNELDFTGGLGLAFVHLLSSLIFVYYRGKLDYKILPKYDVFLNSYLLGATVFVVVVFTGVYIEITRIALYFTVSQIFIWPIIFNYLYRKNKHIIIMACVLYALTYYTFFLNKIGNLTPYEYHNTLI